MIYRAFCTICNHAVGRMRKYHDSAVEELDKHCTKFPDHYGRVLSAADRGSMVFHEEQLAREGIY